MTKNQTPDLIKWAREIQALSQSGLAYQQNEYEKERYSRLMEIAAEMTASESNLNKQTILDNFNLQPGYATPKVDVRGAVFRDGKILLVQERSDKKWSMPGGWADVGDLPSETIEREVKEESGFAVKAKKIVAVFDANRDGIPLNFYHAFKIIFLCEIISGDARPSYETLSVDFFDFANLPPLSSSRTNERHLNEIRQHLNKPNRPVYFD
ncbi:NUDIX hydrolase [candidate division KSB1 bacterium 4572_119]|nr:MAG: NUDIX hydrolase [candidate division KSB1 bacterium 4572_119]